MRQAFVGARERAFRQSVWTGTIYSCRCRIHCRIQNVSAVLDSASAFKLIFKEKPDERQRSHEP